MPQQQQQQYTARALSRRISPAFGPLSETSTNTNAYRSSTKTTTTTPAAATTSSSSTRLYARNPNNPNNNNQDSMTQLSQTANNQMEINENTVPQVYPQRWVQLGYLSMLALISDWICFSVAAVPGTYEQAFDHSAAALIDMFLFTNVASSFLVTDVVDRVGLQRAVQGAAVLMAVGCWFRSGLSFLPVLPQAPHLVSYASVVVGTIMVGAAQPFFQCTPPVLSATWFAASERATSTAIALNFNQIGIATAFLVGGAMATNVPGLESYFGLIALLSTVTAVGCLLQFQNEPAIPPSQSELEKKLSGLEEPPFLESVQTFFQTRGFTNALAAFICSISITNIVGAFIDEIMHRGGVTSQLSIDLAGAGFELAILIGGIIIGGFVDKTKEYKKVTMACLAVTAFMCIPLGLTDHMLGQEPVLLVLALLGLGAAAGPVQPINAELAVDVTYPGDETAVESVQQIGGNLISALLVPVAELFSKRDFDFFRGFPGLESDIRGDTLLLVGLALITLTYFSSFDAPLARSQADSGGESEGDNSGSAEAFGDSRMGSLKNAAVVDNKMPAFSGASRKE
eukprot:CAMPEP_0172472212 /NCGR_PEP_ID=MMETSP1065-20121228/68222_1 /TAXON_ID=265537 /ORGANISM="Amphiprora paludosa, Strain CCMP125" /LENGTH=569 /DNA_ID=CAMNT_0013230343 /DNA_START=933 /DNA_END=2642 /DNA_ORIENTATION=-